MMSHKWSDPLDPAIIHFKTSKDQTRYCMICGSDQWRTLQIVPDEMVNRMIYTDWQYSWYKRTCEDDCGYQIARQVLET